VNLDCSIRYNNLCMLALHISQLQPYGLQEFGHGSRVLYQGGFDYARATQKSWQSYCFQACKSSRTVLEVSLCVDEFPVTWYWEGK